MTTSDKTALQGVKVLDFCWVAIGPMTTRYLSDFGATVVRVESIHRIDTLRTATPHKDGIPGINRSGYFANYNGGKYSMALNMGQPEARELAKDLARWADVVTENFTPGVMERWGLGYEDLNEINPSVIMFSASMQGRGGPYSNHPGFGPVLTALSSHTHLNRLAGPNAHQPLWGVYRLSSAPLDGLRHCRRVGPPASHGPGPASGLLAA